MSQSILGVSTHVSSPNNNTHCVTALKKSRHLWIHPLPYQNLRQPPQTLPQPLRVAYHCRPVITTRRHHPSQIPESRQILQRFSIGLKVPLRALTQFLLFQPLSLTFHPPGTLCGGKEPSVQLTPWDQNVALGSPWVGEALLLQNDHGVPDIPVQKMDPHCRRHRCLSQSYLNWAVLRVSLGREVHVVRPRFSPPWTRLYNSISPIPLAHVVPSCDLPSIHPPSRPCTPCTASVSSVTPGRNIPILSSVSSTPPLTGYLPPSMGGRPCQLSS